MKLIFIRHAEPDYKLDSLTEKGAREAALLGERTQNWPISQVYCSPMGRAQKTALPTLKSHGITLSHTYPQAPDDILPGPDPTKALVCPWLREFAVGVNPVFHPTKKFIPWDFTPAFLDQYPQLLDRNHWWETPLFTEPITENALPREVAKDAKKAFEMYQKLYGTFYQEQPGIPKIKQEYDWVTGRLDEVLSQWGYHRSGLIYRTDPPAKEPSDAWMSHEGKTAEDTLSYAASRAGKMMPDVSASGGALLTAYEDAEPVLVFFCHLGIMDVLISHLINVAPAVLHHGYFCAPSSVTVLTAEERIPGEALFRIQVMGDTSHLRAGNEPVSYYGGFAAPFHL